MFLRKREIGFAFVVLLESMPIGLIFRKRRKANQAKRLEVRALVRQEISDQITPHIWG